MEKFLLSFSLCFFTTLAIAQQSLLGIQNSPRKGMIHAAMNPAELNHLSRKVEFNLFAVGASASNNVLTFGDIIKEEDLLNLAFERVEGPVNVDTEIQLLGPSFGFIKNKWAFGFLSQAFIKGDIMDLNTDLGSALYNSNYNGRIYEVEINNSSNQRVNTAGWAELGIMAGREIWSNDNHIVSVGGTFKFLIPGAYVNLGVNNLQGNFIQNQDESHLTNARGHLDISYPQELKNWDVEDQMLNRFSIKNISGFALDLGVSHQWKKEGILKFSSGLSLKNLGGLNFASGQVTNAYTMDIPEGEFFRLDALEGDLDEIENQLLGSGYFTRSSQTGGARLRLPTILSAYTDMQVSRTFHVSVFVQNRLSNSEINTQLSTQNVLAITPRWTWGPFEIYSPWAYYEISGITGGAGLRLGGFFVGSQSVLTGVLANSKQVDAHVGFSLGFGPRKPQPL
jgi:hypothetical protein